MTHPPLDHQMVDSDGRRIVFTADDHLWAAAIKAVPVGRLPDIFLHSVRSGQNLRSDYLMTYFGEHIKDKYELAFFAAVRRDNLDVTKKLLAAGVSPDAQIGKALIMAVENQSYRALAFLLSVGADVRILRHRAMMNAADAGDVAAMKIFQAAGHDLKIYENEILRRAVRSGHLQLVQYLLSPPIYADPNDLKGDALKIALMTKNKAMVELLFEKGARVDASSFGVLETIAERENAPKDLRDLLLQKHLAEEQVKRARERIYAEDLFFELFEKNGYALVDLRQVLHAHGGVSGFQLAVMAGKIEQVIEKMKAEKSHFILADLMYEGNSSKRSAADILHEDGMLGLIFEPSLWGYRAAEFSNILHYVIRKGYVAPLAYDQMMASFQRKVIIDHAPKKAFQFKKK